MAEREPADDASDMELLDAVKSIIYLLMSATDKLTRLFTVLARRRVRELRHPTPPEAE